MLGCDQAKCSAVDGPSIAALAQKRNLGFIDLGSASNIFKGAESLLSKIGQLFGGVLTSGDPTKQSFDYVATSAWDQYKQVLDLVSSLRRNNQLTPDVLKSYAASLHDLMAQFEGYYNQARWSISDQAWLDRTFRSYYDPMAGTYQAWMTEASQGIGTKVYSAVATVAAGGGMQFLVLGVLALALLGGARRRRMGR